MSKSSCHGSFRPRFLQILLFVKYILYYYFAPSPSHLNVTRSSLNNTANKQTHNVLCSWVNLLFCRFKEQMASGDWPSHCALLKIPGIFPQAAGVRVVDFGVAYHQNRFIIHYLGFCERGKWTFVIVFRPNKTTADHHLPFATLRFYFKWNPHYIRAPTLRDSTYALTCRKPKDGCPETWER